MKLVLIFLLIIFSLYSLAQEVNHSNEHTGNHEHHKNEIGMANSLTYFVKEKVFAYGLHLHYVRNIPESKFGFGLGYENIFDEHKHKTIGLEGTYRPIEKLCFGLSPGITMEGNSSEVNFALHLETSYEFEIKHFHIGPAFEFAYDQEDYHLSLGLHIGYGF